MAKKVLFLGVFLILFGSTVLFAQQESNLTPRQQLLKQLPKDAMELVLIGEDTVATWSVTKTSGEPLEMIDSVIVAENSIIETTVWAAGQNLKSVLVVATTDQGPAPQLAANFKDGRVEATWQKRSFSDTELAGIREYAEMIVKVVLDTLGIASDDALKKYIEKDHI